MHHTGNVTIEIHPGPAASDQTVEVIERKGTGHPDQICDSVAEAIALALSQEYLRRFGVILHHNIDKSLLAAGRAAKRFNGGEILQPMEFTIGDRATFRARGEEIPVEKIAVSAATDWIRKHLRLVDPERHVQFRIVLAPGSEELVDIFSSPGILGANDTSAAVGYFPFSPAEQAVLGLERYLNGREFKGRHPYTGEDVKVMGLRRGLRFDVTVAMPLLASNVGSEGEYFALKKVIEEEITGFLAGSQFEPHLYFNALDQPGRGLDGIYLSLLGTSAEDADSGQVGRGNRVNGLISFCRPMGTEAAAGKNGISHVGKIYNVLAHHLARCICQENDGIREAYVYLLSRIGTPVDRPQLAMVRLNPEKGRTVREVRRKIEDIIDRELSGMDAFCRALCRGDFPVC